MNAASSESDNDNMSHLCPYCGQEHPHGARFCPNTGNLLQDTVNCPVCGQEIQSGWAVCPSCGTQLLTMEEVPETKKGYLRWLLIVAVILLVAAGVGYLASQYNSPEDIALMLSSFFQKNSKLGSTATVDGGFVTIKSSEDVSMLGIRTLVPSITPLSANTPSPTVEFVTTPTFKPSTYSEPTPVPENDQQVGRIAFTCQIYRSEQRNQICLINADGSDWSRLTRDDYTDHDYPTWTPDGNRILFAEKIDAHYQIVEIDIKGNEHPLTDLPYDAYAPAVSPDGSQVIFTVNDGNHQTLWIMERNGANPHSLLSSNQGDSWDAVWSPDGKQILFSSNRVGGIQIFVMRSDGSNIRQVTHVSGLRGRSDWSPDGTTIATYVGASWHREIVLFNLQGKQVSQLTNGGNNLAPSYSPDGQWLAFTTYRDHYGDDNGCEIDIMRIDGSHVTRLTNNEYCDWQPRWGSIPG
jgi:TolB protein